MWFFCPSCVGIESYELFSAGMRNPFFIYPIGSIFLTGFPILTHFLKKKPSSNGGFNLGGINATGQVPIFPNNFGLIDKDTPQEAYKKKSYVTGEELILVFSDEFNEEGRTFYPGDDPFWEAVDLHYWGTVGNIHFLPSNYCLISRFAGRMTSSGTTLPSVRAFPLVDNADTNIKLL